MESTHRVRLKDVIPMLLYFLLLPVAPFLAAGTIDWPAAWAYTVFTLVLLVLSRVLAARLDPGLIHERAHYYEHKDVQPWDKVLVPLVGQFGPLSVLVVAGLNRRFDWPPSIPALVQVIGGLMVVAGYAFSTWAMVVNRFFGAMVRIQSDRGHAVVTAGPYRFVRHPGYAGAIVAFFGIALALESAWALVPAALTSLLVILRAGLEDRFLMQRLDGYYDYAARVTYRLLPGVW